MMGSNLKSQTPLFSVFNRASLLVISFALAVPKSYGAAPVESVQQASAPAANSEQLSARIAKLVDQLGDPQYLVRQAAQEQLLRLGPDAFDALIAAENSEDIEIASREISATANSYRS